MYEARPSQCPVGHSSPRGLSQRPLLPGQSRPLLPPWPLRHSLRRQTYHSVSRQRTAVPPTDSTGLSAAKQSVPWDVMGPVTLECVHVVRALVAGTLLDELPESIRRGSLIQSAWKWGGRCTLHFDR